MPVEQINAEFSLIPSFCNQWPHLVIEANDQILWDNFVTAPTVVAVNFNAQPTNRLRIKYINKQNGPDVWDTTMDEQGNILQDQHVILTSCKINRAKCDWLMSTVEYCYLNGTKKLTHGFMDLQGFFEIVFPQDVYAWIVSRRAELNSNSSKTSALDYKNVYIPRHESLQSLELINETQKLIEQLHV